MSYATFSTLTIITDPSPGGTDHLELRAAEIANRDGHISVTNEDRESAYLEWEETALPVPPEADASH